MGVRVDILGGRILDEGVHIGRHYRGDDGPVVKLEYRVSAATLREIVDQIELSYGIDQPAQPVFSGSRH